MAENARGLLADAELLLEAGRWSRAYSLALLAAEEWAKAYAVLTLSFMTPKMRAQVPVREFLEGHRLKLMSALLMWVLDAARPGVAGRIAAMPDLAEVLSDAGNRRVLPMRRSSAGCTRTCSQSERCRCPRT